MCLKLFSSVVLREIIKEIGLLQGEDFHECHCWAETMTTTYSQEFEECPVLYLTEAEDSEARKYLSLLKSKEIDVAEEATRLIRSKHAREIRESLQAKHNGWPVFAKHENVEKDHYPFPKDDGAPASFKEWFAVTSVWRLTRAMPELSYQDATVGTAGINISVVPKEWQEKLEECLKITEASAILPVPKCWGLPLRRRDLDSILPTEDESGLLTNGIINSWFRSILARRERNKPGRTVLIPPDSLDMVGSTPQVATLKKTMVDRQLEMVLFPIVIKAEDHCLMVVALPKKNIILVLDPHGSESTKRLQKDRPWIKENHEAKEGEWEVRWIPCADPGAEVACGVFMLANSLSLIVMGNPGEMYTHQDTTFLRRYIAAVICMGKFPERILS